MSTKIQAFEQKICNVTALEMEHRTNSFYIKKKKIKKIKNK